MRRMERAPEFFCIEKNQYNTLNMSIYILKEHHAIIRESYNLSRQNMSLFDSVERAMDNIGYDGDVFVDDIVEALQIYQVVIKGAELYKSGKYNKYQSISHAIAELKYDDDICVGDDLVDAMLEYLRPDNEAEQEKQQLELVERKLEREYKKAIKRFSLH